MNWKMNYMPIYISQKNFVPGFAIRKQIMWRDEMRSALLAAGASESVGQASHRLKELYPKIIYIYLEPKTQKIYVPDKTARNLAGLREVDITYVLALGPLAII